MSLQGHSLQGLYTKFEHFKVIRFLSYTPNITVKNALTDPETLTFEPQNCITSRESQSHSLYQVWRLSDDSFLSYAPNIIA